MDKKELEGIVLGANKVVNAGCVVAAIFLGAMVVACAIIFVVVAL